MISALTLTETRLPCTAAPELFFPAPNEKSNSKEHDERVRKAAQLCWDCPVWQQCRTEPQPGEDGVWGGIDEQARAHAEGRRHRSDRVRRVPAACGTGAGAKAHRARGEKACQSCLTGEQRERREREARKLAAT